MIEQVRSREYGENGVKRILLWITVMYVCIRQSNMKIQNMFFKRKDRDHETNISGEIC